MKFLDTAFSLGGAYIIVAGDVFCDNNRLSLESYNITLGNSSHFIGSEYNIIAEPGRDVKLISHANVLDISGGTMESTGTSGSLYLVGSRASCGAFNSVVLASVTCNKVFIHSGATLNLDKIRGASGYLKDVGSTNMENNQVSIMDSTVSIRNPSSLEIGAVYCMHPGGGSSVTLRNNWVSVGGTANVTGLMGSFYFVKSSDNPINLTASDNGVFVSGGKITGNRDNISGNTLEITDKGLSVDAVCDFDKYYFRPPADTVNSNTLLTVTGAATVDLRNKDVYLDLYRTSLSVGNEIVLIDATAGDLDGGTIPNNDTFNSNVVDPDREGALATNTVWQFAINN
jgi:hypothetical protein